MIDTRKRFAILNASAAVIMLAGCGDLIDTEEVYTQFGEDCASSFVEEGGPADLAQPFCDCSVAEARERELGLTDFLNEEIMTEIGDKCATEVAQSQGLDAAPAAE